MLDIDDKILSIFCCNEKSLSPEALQISSAVENSFNDYCRVSNY